MTLYWNRRHHHQQHSGRTGFSRTAPTAPVGLPLLLTVLLVMVLPNLGPAQAWGVAPTISTRLPLAPSVGVPPRVGSSRRSSRQTTTTRPSRRCGTTRLAAAFGPPEAIHWMDTLRDVTTGGALSASGDILAQSLAARGAQVDDDDDESTGGGGLAIPPADWDVVRTLSLGVFGALYTGGAQHFIFGFINGSFPDPLHRLLLAQFVFIPFLYYPTYLLLVPTLRTLPLSSQDDDGDVAAVERERLQRQVLDRLPVTLLRNWSFWIPVQFVQFSFIPADMHVTYCAAFGVVWNAILSWSTLQERAPVVPAALQATVLDEAADTTTAVAATGSSSTTRSRTPATVGGSEK